MLSRGFPREKGGLYGGGYVRMGAIAFYYAQIHLPYVSPGSEPLRMPRNARDYLQDTEVNTILGCCPAYVCMHYLQYHHHHLIFVTQEQKKGVLFKT